MVGVSVVTAIVLSKDMEKFSRVVQLVHTFSGYKQVNLNVFLPVLNLLTGQHWGLPLGVLRVDVESVCVCGHGFSLV